MSLKSLKKRAKEEEEENVLPDWVSPKNLTLAAYEHINQTKTERLRYIKRHNQPKDYKKKSLYQITASEVARELGAATTTLTSTSAYSPALKAYLQKINEELEQAKENKLKIHKRTLSGGLQQRKKDDLKQELKEAREELAHLKQYNALEQAREVFAAMPLPIKRKLGLDV